MLSNNAVVGSLLGLATLIALLVIFAGILKFVAWFRYRRTAVRVFQKAVRSRLMDIMVAERRAGLPFQRWRVDEWAKYNTLKMLFSRKPLTVENFWKDTAFLNLPREEPKPMYALFAKISGEWKFAGFDSHEEHAVLFIEHIDKTFGENSAFVAKLPSDNDPQISNLLHKMHNGEVDFEAMLTEFRKDMDN